MKPSRLLPALAVLSFLALSAVLLLAFQWTPTAQCAAGCLAQKIFYFHVPSAYSMYLGVAACVIGSIGYLTRRTSGWDALAHAGGEVAVLYAAIVLPTGMLWGWKAWGTPWVWDPRLTSTLLGALIMVAYLVLRADAGEAEKRFSAAVAVLGAAIMPIIHFSVQMWRGQHPTVITRRGGGVDARMGMVLGMGFLTFTLLSVVLVWLRARQRALGSRLEALETEAAAAGLEEGVPG